MFAHTHRREGAVESRRMLQDVFQKNTLSRKQRTKQALVGATGTKIKLVLSLSRSLSLSLSLRCFKQQQKKTTITVLSSSPSRPPRAAGRVLASRRTAPCPARTSSLVNFHITSSRLIVNSLQCSSNVYMCVCVVSCGVCEGLRGKFAHTPKKGTKTLAVRGKTTCVCIFLIYSC